MPSSSSMQLLGGESPNFNMKNIGTVLKVTVCVPSNIHINPCIIPTTNIFKLCNSKCMICSFPLSLMLKGLFVGTNVTLLNPSLHFQWLQVSDLYLSNVDLYLVSKVVQT